MQSRLHERYQAILDATVTDIAFPDRIATGQIVDISESGVCVGVSLEFSVATIVKLQLADCALFGHVIHSRCEGDTHQIGIEVIRALIGDSDLARLVNAILAESLPNT